jgi:sulfatase modifying factor 1
MKIANKPLKIFYGFALLLLLPIFQHCALVGRGQDDQGEVMEGVAGREGWTMEAPYGMMLVPGGSFMMGEADQDLVQKVNHNKRKSVSSFFMDSTEVTNNQYRKFIDDLLNRVALPIEEEVNTDENQEQEEEMSRLEKLIADRNINEEFIRTQLHPDSTVWRKDFTNYMADTWIEYYYESPGYDDYPVVGITWEAAKTYANWRTQYLNDYRDEKGLPPYPRFSLPSAAQWEYAARGGKELAKYPWGGPYIRDEFGEVRANFKSNRGDYVNCGPSHVLKFNPNDYGLYDMAGNVAEWTLDAFNPAAISRTWDLDPVYLDDEQPMKVIKGGSWKDISRFLQTGMNDYEHKDSARSYIGFRCVIPYIGAE